MSVLADRPRRMPTATFRFYAELNDFLDPDLRQVAFPHSFNGDASVKDRIEALGVPHTEVDAILVDGEPVTFDYLVQHGDRVSVYPPFHTLPITGTVLRAPYVGEARFVLDIHLGKLANYLRMLGFDALYRNDYDDAEIAALASGENRIVLTRDLGLLKRKEIVYGYYVHSLVPRKQVAEVLHRFDLFDQIDPFHRCLACNGLLRAVPKAAVLAQLEPKTRLYYDEFYRCRQCGQIYWKGSHFERMQQFVRSLQSQRT